MHSVTWICMSCHTNSEASAADGMATIEAGFRAPTSRGLKMRNPASMHLGLLPRHRCSFLPLHAFFAHLETSLAPLLMPPRTRARPALPVPSTDPVADSISSAPPQGDLPPSDMPSEDPDDAEDPGSDDGGPSHYPLSEAAAAAENVPSILLRPPTDENSASAAISLLTPSRSRAVTRPRSGGSANASPAVQPKRRQKQQASPAVSPGLSQPPSPSGVTLRIPPHPHIPTILDRIAGASPVMLESELHVIASAMAQKIDFTDPEVVASFKRVLGALAPGRDIEAPTHHSLFFIPRPSKTRLVLSSLPLLSAPREQ